MLFFYNRALLIVITVLALLQITVARPLPLIEDNALVERRQASKDTPLEFYRRGLPTRAANFISRLRGLSGPRAIKVPRPAPKPQVSLAKTKGVHRELKNMALSFVERVKMIGWHKNKIRNEMKTNPTLNKAHTAEIRHVAHEGGSDPNEKNHITAAFKDRKDHPINTIHNGKPTSSHHVYVNTNGLTPKGKAAWKKNNDIIRVKNAGRTK